MRLFRVTFNDYKIYVVAADLAAAYTKVYFNRKDLEFLEFNEDREISMIELLAESSDGPECRTMLLF